MKLKHIVLIGITLLAAQGLQGAAVGARCKRPVVKRLNIINILNEDADQDLAKYLNEHEEQDIDKILVLERPILLETVAFGAPNGVRLLLLRGAKADVKSPVNENVWHMAAETFRNTKEIIDVLAQQGVPGINEQEYRGLTPLMIASRRDRCSNVVDLLLKAGADATIQDPRGKTALDHAIGDTPDDVLKREMLLKAMQQKTQKKEKKGS